MNEKKTSKKFLSNKKTARQSISLPKELKTKISNYLSDKSKEYPKDERFKSTSSFYTYIMESIMKALEKGKDIDDFDSFSDAEIQSFYDKFSFKALIPFYEMVIETNKYTHYNIPDILRYFMAYRRFFYKNVDFKNPSENLQFIKRLETYFQNNKLGKEVRLELKEKGEFQKFPPISLIMKAHYHNLMFENLKFAAGIFGMIGYKLTEYHYSKNKKFFSITCEPTPLFYSKKLKKKERSELYEYNLSYITNFKSVLADNKDYYLWMKLANDPELIIHFKNKRVRYKWFKKVEEDILKFKSRNNISFYLLKYFEKLHWVSIDNINPTVFTILLSKEKYDEEREFIIENLTKYTKITKKNDRFYFT